MKRVKSLDGLRAIAILMVTAGHTFWTLPASVGSNTMAQLFCNAALGVQIFFVISGYLITKLLLLEREKTGKINIRDFYIRRALRIFPVFFLYILVLIILKYSLVPDIFTDYKLILFAVLYLWNYKQYFIKESVTDHGNFHMAHFWSLSMEEQFYLLWPVVFIKNNKERLIKITIIMMFIIPVIRVAGYFLMPGSRAEATIMLHTAGDTIIMGCFGALLEQTACFKERLIKILSSNLLIIVVFGFLFIISPLLGIHLKGIYTLTVGQSLNNLCILILLFWTVYIPSRISSVLNSKVLVHIGVLSYSLYIWQAIFMSHKINFWTNHFPQNIFFSFAAGFISYYLIEKPILRLKNRFKRV